MFAFDYLCARYTLSVQARHAVAASVTATGIALCSGVLVLTYVASVWNLVPAMLGAFIGTYVVMRKERIT